MFKLGHPVLMVAYDGACSPNVSVRMARISDIIDSVLWHWEVGRAKDLSAPLYLLRWKQNLMVNVRTHWNQHTNWGLYQTIHIILTTN
jgi:hypothetical protein